MKRFLFSTLAIAILLVCVDGRSPMSDALIALARAPFQVVGAPDTARAEPVSGKPTHPATARTTATIPASDTESAPMPMPPAVQHLPPVPTMTPPRKTPTVAQSAPAPSDTEPNDGDQAPSAAKPLPQVDESALRYFAQKGDTKRLRAEIARLKALYPNWTPPADPLAVAPVADKQLDAMWKLYADGKYPELRQAIAERQKREANWQPPGDLLKLLAVAETRERLVNASNLKQYDTVIRLAAATPSLLTCSEIDMLWRVGEAFARTDRPQRAEDDYRYILTNCPDKANRLATMQKALALLPRDRMDKLLTLERGAPDSEFGAIRDELARRSVSRGGNEPTYSATPADLARIEGLAQSGGLPSDALLLGWYDYRHNQLEDAEKWFRKARQTKDTASASQGLALVLIKVRKPAEAESVIYPWRASSADAKAVYLAAVANLLAVQPLPDIDETVLKRMADEVAADKDPAAAQQFGWYARALNQFAAAEAWFRMALSWKRNDEPSAYGLALTLDSLGRKKDLADIVGRWRGRSPRIAAILERKPTQRRAAPISVQPETESPQPNPEAQPATVVVETQEPVRPRAAAVAAPVRSRGCRGRVDVSALAAQSALDRGWCLMDLKRPFEAASSFGVALQKGSGRIREDAAYGQSLAYLRLGLTGKAAIAATQAPLSASRQAELQASILSDRANTLFNKGRYDEALIALDQRTRYAAERNDLMVLRGYAYLRLHRLLDARKVFEAAAATGNRDAMRGLADVRSELYPSSN